MQEHGDAAVAETLDCPLSDLAVDGSEQGVSKWLVIDPSWQRYLDDVARIAAAPSPGDVWAPNEKFHWNPEPPLYDSLDRYDWAAAEIWDIWHRNPTAFRAIRVVATGDAVSGVSQYAVVEDRLLRDWIIDPASPDYSRMHEVACLHGGGAYDSWQVGEYGSGDRRHDGRSEASRAAEEVLRTVDGFKWLLFHTECTGTTDPYLALAVRPHIGQRLDQQSYDVLRRGFEAQHGELLHPDDQPLADIRYKAVERR